jgi:hypothetical protein
LLVDVSITAASIVEAAWARAVANRERLQRRLDVQAVREEASTSRINGRSSGLGWELQYTTPTPSLYKPDEPVAHPLRAAPSDVPIYPVAAGHFTQVLFNEGIVGGSALRTSDQLIASGDGSAVIYMSTLFGDRRFVFDWSLGSDLVVSMVFPLPGDDAMIIGFFAESYDFTSGAYPELEPTAKYVRVTHTSVSEVSIAGLPFESILAAAAANGYNLSIAISNINLYEAIFPLDETKLFDMPPLGDSDVEPSGLFYGSTTSGNAITPVAYTIVDVFDGGDRDTLLAAATGSDVWFDDEYSINAGFRAKPGTERPARLPSDGGSDAEWQTILSWDGTVPDYCLTRLEDWGYTP